MNINTILKNDKRGCSRGAPMGARNINNSETPLHLQQVNIRGDYAADGTYWGYMVGENLYCAFNGSDCTEYAPGMGTRIYVRAKNRREAILAINADLPFDAEFKRGTK